MKPSWRQTGAEIEAEAEVDAGRCGGSGHGSPATPSAASSATGRCPTPNGRAGSVARHDAGNAHTDRRLPYNPFITTTYRYMRPPRKRKAIALEVPAIVRAKDRPLGGWIR